MARLTSAAAEALGVRILSPDRPGISESSFEPGRTLLGWPPLVRALMDHLGIERLSVLAISGGAPYACATAWAMPEAVEAIALVSGAPPIAELKDRAGLLRLYRWLLALQARSPRLLRAFFHVAGPLAAIRWPQPMMLRTLQPLEAEVLRDREAFNACFESSRRAWRASVAGVLADAEIYAQPWGFPLEEIRVPVRLWHGTHDRAFSFRLAEEVAARFPKCRLRIVPEAGHYSLPIRHMSEILSDLLDAAR